MAYIDFTKSAAPATPSPTHVELYVDTADERLKSISSTPTTIVFTGNDTADALTNKTLTLSPGTTGVAPLNLTSGVNLTSVTAGAVEYDGTAFYQATNTTNGRTQKDGWNYFRLTGSGTGITSIADFFGTNDGIPLVANGIYEIEWDCWLSQATASTSTIFTIVTATTALANLTAYYVGTPVAGIAAVGTPQTAGVNTTSSSSTALPATGSLANAATHHFNIHATLTAGNGTSNTRLRLTSTAGTATPLINSFFKVRQIGTSSIGTFVA